MLPDWLAQSLIVLPLVLWIYLGLGIPYALLALPRAAWARKAEVLALAFAFGAALLTIWGFILGTIGGATEMPLLRFDLLLGGTIVLALLGMGLAWHKLKNTQALTPQPPFPASEARGGKNPKESGITQTASIPSLAFDEKLLIGLISLVLILISLATMYWPFTGYDTLWVYGYEGRLYTLLGYIPQSIGYYPQFIPLQYNFLQLAVGNVYADHAARMIVPFLYLGSILAAYSLGERLFSRRVGFFTAAIWALYPHASQWAQVGDLEIPLTFLFTLSASYFLQAWLETERSLRRRYALIAGLCFGIAMWTKPTAGAFVWGVLLLVGGDFLLKLQSIGFGEKDTAFHKDMARHVPTELIRLWYPRFEVAVITGLACMPLGGVWYLRNVLLGLPAIIFPHKNWLSLATRSGDLLSWPLLALFLLLAYLASTRKLAGAWMLLVGTILVLVGAMPSSPLIDVSRRDAPMSYIQWYEALAIIIGLGLIGWTLRKYAFPHKVAWAYLLALPYFLTWFWSYSYHARLSFAIVPLLILPTALVIAQIQIKQKLAWGGLIVLLALYGLAMPIFGIAPTYDWLWTDRYPDDPSKYFVHNGDVYEIALYIDGYEAAYGVPPVVVAVGEQRLPFFLPDVEIITKTVPSTYADLAGATHFIYGTLARWVYEDAGIAPLDNQLVASLGRTELFNKVYDFEDGNFEYELYELNLAQRFQIPASGVGEHLISDEVIFAGAIQYIGDSRNNERLAGNDITLSFLFQPIVKPAGNYHLRLSLVNTQDNNVVYVWEDRPPVQGEETYYNTALWEVGEYVVDRQVLRLEAARNYPRGANIYRIRLNFVDSETGEILPTTINGTAAEGYLLEATFSNGN